jgi:hypothetical protein
MVEFARQRGIGRAMRDKDEVEPIAIIPGETRPTCRPCRDRLKFSI